ncbi:hypothetical protein ACFOW1_00320 [Parasediminibacterium paludis]|uniref:HEAT repeat protein n=1 Tax=Parasediminibacterium paludis TaxID=908966 RepID=A0ABV8PR27_9BACT
MNIAEAILEKYSTDHAIAITTYAASSRAKFKELMDCFASDHYRLSQRASWCVNWAAKKYLEMLEPYIDLLVERLQRPNANDSVQRNALRILNDTNIPEQHHGNLMNICFAFIEDPNTATAVTAFSLHMLRKLSKFYPEILPELQLLIEDRIDNETPAFKSAAKQILKLKMIKV